MRGFIALSLPSPVRAALQQLQERLAATQADVAWVRPGQLHLTLKFLDEITPAQVQALQARLAALAAAHPPFRCRLAGLGAFPSPAAPRVIWVGVAEGQEAVIRLAQAIEQLAAEFKLRQEARAFSAHVTLGRVRSGRGRAALQHALAEPWAGSEAWDVTSVQLYQSVLNPTGAVHTLLAGCPLRK